MTKNLIIFSCLIFFPIFIFSQKPEDKRWLSIDRIYESGDFQMDYFGQARWMEDGKAYTTLEKSEKYKKGRDIVSYETKTGNRTVLVEAEKLIPTGEKRPLSISNYIWSHDKKQLMIFTNTTRVWRYHTKGDYWVLNLKSGRLHQLGKNLKSSSLMFAKFSPNDNQVAYVSEHNVYVEEISSGAVKQLTFDGSTTLINGTFDWAYEEEFSCRDGFRWSPDGKNIAYWQVDAKNIRNFLMINNTDSIYSQTIPVQYPKVGEDPSSCKIGVVATTGGKTKWMDIPGDQIQNYLPRMMWGEDSKHLLSQQINRKQNTLKLWWSNIKTGISNNIHTEIETAWIDAVEPDDWLWLDQGKSFTWTSQKDGWQNLYSISKDGKKETLLSPGNYDVISIQEIDIKGGWVYFIASPDNPTQRYLYRSSLKKQGKAERLSPDNQVGTHSYQIAPGGKFAFHTFSNANTPPMKELISLPHHRRIKLLYDNEKYKKVFDALATKPKEFFRVKTEDGVEMDGYMMKPHDFDPSKKYPVIFYVYGEPWGQTAKDEWDGNLYHQMLTQKGYIVMTLDNRGTPSPRGREWRKSIYQKIGVINSRDQAMAAKEIQKWDFVDADRLGVWGWSGGGSMTLNLLFRYPEIYKTGISVAPVANQLLYDNIYQERYMGVPWENKEDFVEGSPLTYAKNLEGNLLLVHGTADDNVHYQNAEVLMNELIKHNKLFQVMPYPNRSHGIYEGDNTRRHLYLMMMDYFMKNLEKGGKTALIKP
ncbi:MAG: DPP IV N-terminal domain-containing protein [Saprospiraceae bacterium]